MKTIKKLLIFVFFNIKFTMIFSICYSTDMELTAMSSFCVFIAGKQVGCANDSLTTHLFRTTLIKPNDVIVIEAQTNSYEQAGIYGLFGNQITDTENWKCKATNYNETNWLENNFDDSGWDNAHSLNKSLFFPFDFQRNIPKSAQWISANSTSEQKVYCRYTFQPFFSTNTDCIFFVFFSFL
jgi:hypothetical protein